MGIDNLGMLRRNFLKLLGAAFVAPVAAWKALKPKSTGGMTFLWKDAQGANIPWRYHTATWDFDANEDFAAALEKCWKQRGLDIRHLKVKGMT